MNEEQFLRLERLIGKDNVKDLHIKHVTVVGCGAVGGYAFESLVRCGVGRIRVVDFDTFTFSNINRQILATYSSVGKKKVLVAKERALDIYPDCIVEAVDAFVNEENYREITKDSDLVLDCIDSVNSKIGLISYCINNNIPIISSMGAALRRDPSLIRYSTIKETWGCPLARQVRTGLRKRNVSLDVMCVFSPEKVDFNYSPNDETALEKDEGIQRKKIVLGSLVTITAIFGEMMAHLALSKLLGDESFKGIKA